MGGFALKVIVPWAAVRVKTTRGCDVLGIVLCNWTGPSFPTSPVATSEVAG